jgi:tetratricopeptide (TPR) repeat protein
METILLLLLLIPYMLIRYLITDHETKTEKDARQYKEGIQWVKDKKYTEAIGYFDKVLKEKPNCALAFAYRGKCNLKLKNLYSSVFDCSRATSLDDTLSDAYLDKGKALYQLEEYQQAYLEFDKAVWHNRKNPEAFRWRALGRIRISHLYERVEEDLLEAVELGDEDAAYYLRLIRASHNDNKQDKSIDWQS